MQQSHNETTQQFLGRMYLISADAAKKIQRGDKYVDIVTPEIIPIENGMVYVSSRLFKSVIRYNRGDMRFQIFGCAKPGKQCDINHKTVVTNAIMVFLSMTAMTALVIDGPNTVLPILCMTEDAHTLPFYNSTR